MSPESHLTSDDVRRIAADGRVKRHTTYHARDHNVRFRDLLDALLFCQRVVLDTRAGPDGQRRHPNGFVAWSLPIRGRKWRVDFDLEHMDGNEWFLVVTGFEVS